MSSSTNGGSLKEVQGVEETEPSTTPLKGRVFLFVRRKGNRSVSRAGSSHSEYWHGDSAQLEQIVISSHAMIRLWGPHHGDVKSQVKASNESSNTANGRCIG